MKRVYNSNMAAIDDAVGQLREALEAHPATYENRTLIVFSADNGGPFKAANNVPLRGAKFGVFEGGVRSHSFVWGPGVLPRMPEHRTYQGMLHLVDYYTTFAGLAGVDVSQTGPAGFEIPDGVDQWPALEAAALTLTLHLILTLTLTQWPALEAAARGLPHKEPRNEVVIDLNPAYKKGGEIVALRQGDFKIMWGQVAIEGQDGVIPDKDWPCRSCCPLRRSFPVHIKPGDCGAKGAAATEEIFAAWDGDGNLRGRRRRRKGSGGSSMCPNASSPCLFNVVQDISESHNLAKDPAHAGVLAALQARVQYHLGHYFNQSIDHAGITPEQYCHVVKKAQWVAPFVH